MKKKTISVVIPTRNQAKKIDDTIRHIRKVAEKTRDFHVEIIFVNDRSTDNSAEVAQKSLTGYGDYRVLHTDKNYVGNGKGLAVELGMMEAKGDYRIFMDADNSTKFEEILKFFPYFDKFDIILGTRYSNKVVIPSGNWFKSLYLAIIDVLQVIVYGHALRYTAKVKQGRLREFVSRGANLAFTLLLGQSFTDSRCGFKMYSKEASEKIFPLLKIKTWDFDSEALVLAKKFNFSMIEVPVDWYDDEAGSNFKIKDMVNGFLSIFQIRLYQIMGCYDTKKEYFKKVIKSLLVLAVLFMAYFIFSIFYCGPENKEIKAYLVGSNTAYSVTKNGCPVTEKNKRIKIKDLKEYLSSGNFEIVTANRNEGLEAELKSLVVPFDSYKAINGENSFFIYNVKCSACQR